MINVENYFEKQKEVMTLKEKLRYLKCRERIKNLNEQLHKLVQLRKELTDIVSNFNENCEFVSGTIQKIEPLLKSDSKINMNQECAAKFKPIVGAMSLLTNYADTDTVQDLQLNNLNVDTEKLIEDTVSRINAAKMNLHYSSMLHVNVTKLTNRETSIKHSLENNVPLVVVTNTDRQNTVVSSNDLMNCTTESAITFSGVVSSSPLHEHSNRK